MINMATYKKKLKSITIYLLPSGEEMPAITDTATDDKATRMLNEFKNYETMHTVIEQGGEKRNVDIPYHAVQAVTVTETEADIERADAYGCE